MRAFRALNPEGPVLLAWIRVDFTRTNFSYLIFFFAGIYCVSGNVRQFTVNIASERQRRGLQLRGDILIKCYHRHPNSRETIFSCQFHTCAVADYTLSFTRQELDVACNGMYHLY